MYRLCFAMNECAYCLRQDIESYLTCEKCSRKVHLRCLKSGWVPGGLLGDVFYKFICHNCSALEREEFTRLKMPWINLIILTLHNLHHRSEGMGRLGYFHWKMHICSFIERHWNILFGSNVKKKRSWMGTVSGTLSHYSPTYFRSGSEELRESGWWKLALNMAPELLMQQHLQLSVEKKKKFGVASQLKVQDVTPLLSKPQTSGASSSQDSTPSVIHVSHTVPPDESSLSAYDDTSSVELNNAGSERETGTSSSSGRTSTVDSNTSYYNNWAFLKASDNMYSRAYVEPSETLSDCLFADEDEECSDVDVDIEGVDICPTSQGFRDFGELLPQQENGCSDRLAVSAGTKFEPTESNHLKQEMKEETADNLIQSAVEEEVSDEDGDELSTVKPMPPTSLSLFTMTKGSSQVLTACGAFDETNARCLPMSEYEEFQLLKQLRRVPAMGDVPGAVRRLYRKLCVRQLKRERGMALFNLDDIQPGRWASGVTRAVRPVMGDVRILDRYQISIPLILIIGLYQRGMALFNLDDIQPGRWASGVTRAVRPVMGDVRILDRYQCASVSANEEEASSGRTFILRLMGQGEASCFYSPYTRRLLKPYIRRDMETTPLWLRLLREVQAKANKNIPQWHPPRRHPIDYSYVRPQHISSINSLCREFFYPGIDLTECLQYPDFSCVVLYKKLVVGFAFMVPDVGLNEAYISFLFTRPEWRRAGIATFMLYHLIQTCMGKDVTLHVSATNPALILYQKFGFKVEEFVQDFYDKYFPADSKDCKHALFLRLSR